MKELTLFIFLISGIISWGQDTTYVYYDSKWVKIKNKENASYFRKYYRLPSKEWGVQDYFINGALQMEGKFEKKNFKTENGKFVYYYENGKVKSVCEYLHGYYHGEYLSYFNDGSVDSEGAYLFGRKQADWTFYHTSGGVASKEKYLNGGLQTFQFFDEKGNELDDTVYEVEALFPGGDAALIAFIKENVVYPQKAKEMGLRGVVNVDFVVTEDGTLELFEVVQSVDPLLDNEALRIAKLMPNWIPGKRHNRPVRIRYTLPIEFRLR